jgi:predicted nucleic acid-binding protein
LRHGVLLDTNVVSELAKGRRAAPHVARWLAGADENRLYLSVVTLGEIEKGIALAEAEGRSMTAQRRFLSRDLPDRFGTRILPFGSDAALVWGRLLARLKRDQEQVRRLAIDAQIAATAEVARLSIATRNVRAFERLGFDGLLNPFEPAT